LSSLELALQLSRLSVYVFPFRILANDRKVPLTEHGHLDASVDPEQIATWYGAEFPDALVGVAAGPSGLLCGDVDRKNGLDGVQALADAWLELPTTWEHPTPSGGIHHVYTAPDGIRLAPSTNYEGVKGLDIRAGSSWFGWYGEAPTDRTAFTPAPEWLCKPARDVLGGAFEGNLDEWLATLGTAEDEPDSRVLDAIGRIPDDEFGHVEMIERQFEFVRLGSEGAIGVRHGLDLLRAEWLRDQYDTDDNRYQFDAGLATAITRYGALEDRIAELPEYGAAVEKALNGGLDNALVFGAAKEKAHYFRLIRALMPLDLTDAEVVAVVWGAPTTKVQAREWGIDYCYEQLAIARAQWEQDSAPRENTSTTATATPLAVGDGGSLLTSDERELLAHYPTFIDRYMEWVSSTLMRHNRNYHLTCAYTVVSLAFGGVAFVPVDATKKMGVNLYQFALGGSSTGKSDALRVQENVLRPLFAEDGGYNMGSNVSPEALHEKLLTRDGLQAFINADEAARMFKMMGRAGGSYMDVLSDDLTNYYESVIPPVIKKNAKEVSGKTAIVSVSAQFFGTPDWTMKYLDEDMILSGFLARMMWTFGGESDSKDPNRFKQSQATEHVAREANDPAGVALATELKMLRTRLGGRRPILGTDEAMLRLEKNAEQMTLHLESQPLWRLYESPSRRMIDAVRKAAALVALSRGAVRFDVPDVLAAIAQAEVWMDGLQKAVEMLAGSQFSREVDDLAAFVRAKGRVTGERLYAHFSRYDLREYTGRLEAAKARGLIRETHQSGRMVYEWNADVVLT